MRIVGVVLLLIAAVLVVILVLWEPSTEPAPLPRNYLANEPNDDGAGNNDGQLENNSGRNTDRPANNGGGANLDNGSNNAPSNTGNTDNGSNTGNANNAGNGAGDANNAPNGNGASERLPDDPADYRNSKHWRLAGIPAPVPPSEEDDEGRPRTITSEATGSELVLVTAGTFIRGNETERNHHNEQPVQHIFMSAYYIDKHLVTVGQWREFMRDGGYETPEYWSEPGWDSRSGHGWDRPNKWGQFPELQGPDQPVVGISLWEAEAFANWRTVKDGYDTDAKLGYSLPTECQWEKAARGTDGRRYPWGNEWVPEACNWADGAVDERGRVDGYKVSSPVQAYEDYASPYGVCDMAGNVWQWCADHFDDNYYRNDVEKTFSLWSNPFCREFGGRKYFVQRGGAYDFRPNDGHFETTFRYANLSSIRVLNTGFRLCLPAAAVPPDDGGDEDNGPNDNGPNDNGPNDNGPNDNGPNDNGPNDNGPNDNGGDGN